MPVAQQWQSFFFSAAVAHHAGWNTSKDICDHCGEYSTCHERFMDTTRCIGCAEES